MRHVVPVAAMSFVLLLGCGRLHFDQTGEYLATADAGTDGRRPDANVTADGSPVAMHCKDGARNEDETDVDCGGSSCALCPVCARCANASDCDTAACGGDGRCLWAKEIAYDWVNYCNGRRAVATDVPAGSYRIVPLESAARYAKNDYWVYKIGCEGWDDQLTTLDSGPYESTAAAAFAGVKDVVETVTFPGGTLTCGTRDNPLYGQ